MKIIAHDNMKLKQEHYAEVQRAEEHRTSSLNCSGPLAIIEAMRAQIFQNTVYRRAEEQAEAVRIGTLEKMAQQNLLTMEANMAKGIS